MAIAKQYIMHFPEFTFLGSRYCRFTGLHTALVNPGQWKMPEIKPDLPFIFFQELLYNLVCFGAIFILIFAKLHQSYRGVIFTHENVFWFNDLYGLFFK